MEEKTKAMVQDHGSLTSCILLASLTSYTLLAFFFFFLTEICSKINGADKNQMDVQKCRITYI